MIPILFKLSFILLLTDSIEQIGAIVLNQLLSIRKNTTSSVTLEKAYCVCCFTENTSRNVRIRVNIKLLFDELLTDCVWLVPFYNIHTSRF